ncbi:sensor domain-containing diguanylate cyclase [Acidisoma cellulosilytica]|uniref:Sensor domain-containing diguanylate cyclase n=1 Tax=Acidisoma cellulosilyticum TaxID=2802395 RepID=A0A964E7G2_9PROT|nr:sensor domain-containing diguanylate cyclase [Acidisoma cellulosilyticum]MCB8883968.1 sensor domain-containing diguanylate cyclase [Acidisoma cellulosilyticum]
MTRSDEIIDQLRAELAACQQSNKRWLDFIALGSDFITEVDSDFRIVRSLNTQSMDIFSNPSLESLRASNGTFSLFEILDHAISDDLVRTDHIADLKAHKPFRNLITTMPGPEGKLIWFEINGNPVFSESGEFQGYRSVVKDITQRKEDEARIAFMAHHDLLTNLPNRTTFYNRIKSEFAQTDRGGCFALLFLDLDGFKLVNDTLGHPSGDNLLQQVATRLNACVRKSDLVARLGGDEFAVIQSALTNLDDAHHLAQRIVDTIGEPYDLFGSRTVIGATIGIAIVPHDGNEIAQLLKNADIALYRAKSAGRGRYMFFEAGMDTDKQG